MVRLSKTLLVLSVMFSMCMAITESKAAESYTIRSQGKLTKEIINNLSYYIYNYGIPMSTEFPANENPKPELIKFENGKCPIDGTDAEFPYARVTNIAMGSLVNNENSAAILISQSDGGNSEENKICSIVPMNNLYQISCIDLESAHGINYTSIKIKDRKIYLSTLSRGYTEDDVDPACCPTYLSIFKFKIDSYKIKDLDNKRVSTQLTEPIKKR